MLGPHPKAFRVESGGEGPGEELSGICSSFPGGSFRVRVSTDGSAPGRAHYLMQLVLRAAMGLMSDCAVFLGLKLKYN